MAFGLRLASNMLQGSQRPHRACSETPSFLDDYFITYPIFTSPPVQESALGDIPGLPTTFLVSPQGEVVARQVGGVTREMIEKFIQKWEANNHLTGCSTIPSNVVFNFNAER